MEKIGVQAVLDNKDFNKGLDSYTSGLDKAKKHTADVAASISGKLGDIGGAAVNMGASLAKIGFATAAAGVAAFTGALTYSIKAAAEAQQIDAQLDAVLKSTAGAAGMSKDAITGLANSLSQVTMFEDDAIVAGESMLLTFTNIGADVFPLATEAMLDLSQAMGQDMKSSAIQLGKALNDPVTGMTALQRVGVTFTEEQKNTVKALVETGHVADAQRLILAELTKEFGGSARAAGETLPGAAHDLEEQPRQRG